MSNQFTSYRANLNNKRRTPPRVLLMVGFLWGDEGIVESLVALSEGLMKCGWEVAIASPMVDREETQRFTRGPQWFESQGIQHFFVPFPNLRTAGKKFITSLQALLRLNRVIHQFNPDIIHIHSLSLFPYAQAMRLRHKIPYISTAHIEPSTSRSGVKFTAFINKYFSSFLCDRFIAISTEVQESYANNLKVPRESIKLICHGIENAHFRPPSFQERLDARVVYNLSPTSKVVCLIGRLYPIKGHDVLLRALAILKYQGLEVVALCAGAGDQTEQESIRVQTAQLGISHLVRLLGFSEPRQVLWASNVLALPSRLEGFGLVVPEAMLCGVVPVRTPAAGALDQIEDGINGFVFPFDDSEALAMRLGQLFKDEELRARMSAAALESARQKFTLERMIRDTIEVYEEAIAGSVR